MYNDIEQIWISKEDLAKRIKEMAVELDGEYKGKNPLMICILRGAVLFFADLIREMEIPLSIDFMSISSYGAGVKTSGEVKLVKDLDTKLAGRDVIIVEDIMDSGYTLQYLKKNLEARGPSSVKICCLLDKPSRREVELYPDYKGFEIENQFVVGYGLDYDQKYRNLPEIGILKPSVYQEV